MTTSRVARRAGAAAAVLVVMSLGAACSFTGSVDRPQASSTRPGSAAAGASSSRRPPAAPPGALRTGTAAGTSVPLSRGGGPVGGASVGTGTDAPSPAAAAASAPGTGAPDRCATQELTGSLVAGSPGAGQRYATLVLRDTGGRTCAVEGYGGLGLYDAAGQAVPTDQVRVPVPAPRPVVLRPGDAASSQLHWSAVGGAGDMTGGACQPVAATLRVIPPGETGALSLPWSGGPVCERGRIDQQAYTAG